MSSTNTISVIKLLVNFRFLIVLKWRNFHLFLKDQSKSKEENVVEELNHVDSANNNEVISLECLVKHPLEHKWTLWYLETERNKSWEDSLHNIASFETVEDFWSLYKHIVVPSELKFGNDYSLFKKNIRPMWEDKANKRGGRWLLTINKTLRLTDVIWLDIVRKHKFIIQILRG